MMSATSIPSGRYSPLRYPGGKGKLARFVIELIRLNKISDGLYVEPYAGGAAVAWELLLTGVVKRVSVNDINRPVYAFWRSVIDHTDEISALINDTKITVSNRDKQKKIYMNKDDASDLELGFALFFLNRTHRSGILNGGMIGGRDQTGKWKIDARFNKPDLIDRIQRIASVRSKIKISNLDAIKFIRREKSEWGQKTLVYLDPPYFEKGRQLYDDFYKPNDHENVANTVQSLKDVSWVVSYDDALPIHELYAPSPSLQYTIGYSAREKSRGREAMFFSRNLIIPEIQGSMVEIKRSAKQTPKRKSRRLQSETKPSIKKIINPPQRKSYVT